MAEQPHYRPLQPSAFFLDGRSARPLVPGTVARESADVASLLPYAKNPGAEMKVREYVTEFPFAISEQDLARGRQRYDIFCSVCHDRLGTGQGRIVQRGFTKPPNFHDDLSRGYRLHDIDMSLREAPPGYLFDVITNGFGAMPDYASEVPPRDRWLIIAYIRVLQLSQRYPLADLPAEAKEKLESKDK
jgi:mono/diheme cytochrome c family protein